MAAARPADRAGYEIGGPGRGVEVEVGIGEVVDEPVDDQGAGVVIDVVEPVQEPSHLVTVTFDGHDDPFQRLDGVRAPQHRPAPGLADPAIA